MFAKSLVTAAAILCAVPAGAAVTVIGNSAARTCYEAARSPLAPSYDGFKRCDFALDQEALSSYDIVATHVNRGILRLRKGQVDGAIRDFDDAIARDPNEAEAYLNKASAMLRRPQGWQDAVPLFDQALAKKTDRPELAHYGRAIAHEMGGNLKQAYLDYRQASVLAPKWKEPAAEMARFTVRRN